MREKCGAASRVLPVLLAVCLIFTLFPAPRANATMSSMYGYVDNWKVTSSGANRYTYDGGYHNAGALSVGTVVTICSVIDTGWGSTPDGYCVLVEGSSKEAKCFTRMNGGFPDTGTYITGSSAVKVHNKPSGDGTVVGTVPANTVVNIKRTCFNTSGNPWGENADGNWIYLGYLTKHTHQAAMCGAPSTTYAQKDENSHYKYFYNGDELCSCGQYMGKGTTTTTVEAHTFSGDVCTQCGYRKPSSGGGTSGGGTSGTALTVTGTWDCDYTCSIPANYRLNCYKTPNATNISTYISAKSSGYDLACTQKVLLSDGTIRYFFVSGDGYSLYFNFVSGMSVISRPVVYFNGNGGSAGSPSLQVVYGRSYGTLPNASRDGYAFAGWYTDPNGGYRITQDTSVITDSDHTLYAHWTQNAQYRLTFNVNGGSVVSAVTGAAGTTVDLSGYTTTRSGYTFTGWYSDPTLTNRVYSMTLNSDTAVFAGWKQSSQHILTFNVNGGSVVSAVTGTAGTTINLSGYTTTRSGYTFTGWYSDPALTNRVYSVTLNSDTSVFAGWKQSEKKSFTITFSTGNGTKVAPITAKEGDTVSISGYTPSLSGYTFAGWYDHPIEDATRLYSVTLSADVTVFARWVKNSSTPQSGFPFTDVNSGDWYYSAVKYVYSKGLMSGTSQTEFSPYSTTSRGMIVAILYRLAGSPNTGSANPFSDVSAGDYYYNAVTWAASKGIVNGTGNGRFSPQKAITREQLATILFNYAIYKGYDVSAGGASARYAASQTDLGHDKEADLSGYADSGKISGYAYNAMKWAVSKGLISGVGGNRLDPGGSAQRCQAAGILMRFCTNVVK